MTTCSCNWKKTTKEESSRLREVLRLLQLSNNYVDGTTGRGQITGLQHALRTAAQAVASANWPDAAFVALVHDLARPLNDVHHGEIIAEIVRDRVGANAYHILRTHGQYQAAIIHNTRMPQFQEGVQRAALQLAGFEVRSFQAEYDGPTMSIGDAKKLLHTYLA